MKNIVITGSDILREFIIWAGVLLVSIGINIYAIISYEGDWSELYTQLHIVFALSVVLYLLVGIVRAIVSGVRLLTNRTLNDN